MAFTSFTSVSEAARAVQDFLYDRDAHIPDDLREKLRNLVGPTTSPVDTVVHGAEMIYARKDELSPELLELAAGLALVGQQYNFHGMANEDRGSKMALAFMRDAKVRKPVGIDYPKKETDPEPKSEFIATPQVLEPVVTTDAAQEPEPNVTAPVEGSRRGRGRRTGETNKS
jgi:hypothetical protein